MLEFKNLIVDWKGESDDWIVVNYILDYEFENNIELASKEELENLAKFWYEDFNDKIKETNRILLKSGYGLFSYPSDGDHYTLFIDKLENKDQWISEPVKEVEEWLPRDAYCIMYYI